MIVAKSSTIETDEGERNRAARRAAVIAAVLGALGTPPDFLRVTVVNVWGDRFRVNVMTGDAASARVAHSYFLTADESGRVLDSEPAIARLY
jgi:hypothetical protein